jgi:hypothetical protein
MAGGVVGLLAHDDSDETLLVLFMLSLANFVLCSTLKLLLFELGVSLLLVLASLSFKRNEWNRLRLLVALGFDKDEEEDDVDEGCDIKLLLVESGLLSGN